MSQPLEPDSPVVAPRVHRLHWHAQLVPLAWLAAGLCVSALVELAQAAAGQALALTTFLWWLQRCVALASCRIGLDEMGVWQSHRAALCLRRRRLIAWRHVGHVGHAGGRGVAGVHVPHRANERWDLRIAHVMGAAAFVDAVNAERRRRMDERLALAHAAYRNAREPACRSA